MAEALAVEYWLGCVSVDDEGMLSGHAVPVGDRSEEISIDLRPFDDADGKLGRDARDARAARAAAPHGAGGEPPGGERGADLRGENAHER